MQEEVDQKVISLCVTGMRMSKDVLKIAMRKWLSAKEQKKQEKSTGSHTKRGCPPVSRGTASLLF